MEEKQNSGDEKSSEKQATKQEEKSSEENNSQPSMIDEAKKIAERIENANKKTEELLKKQEKMLAEQALEGSSFSGSQKKKEPETAREYSEKVLRGTI